MALESDHGFALETGTNTDKENVMSKPKIIIVDDQPENLQILVEILKSEYSVIATTSPNRALELARDHPRPEAILLDVIMPEMDGFSLCEKLKSIPEISDVPVLFVTSAASEDDYQKGLSAGGDDFLQKPVSATLLLHRLNRARSKIS